MKEKVLGLDIGTASVGWALIEREGLSNTLIDKGVRMFKVAELAKDRRQSRGARRLIYRKKQRGKGLCKLFNLKSTTLLNKDPYILRKEGLERILTKEELFKVLYSLLKRRGYYSPSLQDSIEEKKGKEKGVKEGLKKFSKELLENNAETIGSYLATKDIKRNKDGEYSIMVYREASIDEFRLLFNKQREFGSSMSTEEFEEICYNIIFYQRPLKSMYDMIGECTFEECEKRAPKGSYSGELFIALNKLVNETVIDPFTNEERRFTAEEIKDIIKLAENSFKIVSKGARKGKKEYEGLSYRELKNYLGSSDYLIKNQKKSWDKTLGQYKSNDSDIYISFKTSSTIKELIKDNFGIDYYNNINNINDMIDNIVFAIVCEKSREPLKERMKESNIPEEIINCILNNYIGASEVVNLSFKAIKKLVPYMQEGELYYDACVKAGYVNEDIKEEVTEEVVNKIKSLTNEELPSSPSVKRGFAQSIKVINAVLRKYGKIDRIIIETARDLGRSKKAKEEIEKKMREAAEHRENVKKEYKEKFKKDLKKDININDDMLKKCLLHKEQDCMCLYTGAPIKLEELLPESTEVEIDHIIPRSLCYSSRMSNLCLIKKGANANKGNLSMHEFFQQNYQANYKKEWGKFVGRVKSLHLCETKEYNLLSTTLDLSDFQDRQLADTRYINKFLANYLKETLSSVKVETRSGDFINYLKSIWKVYGKDRSNHRHHAVDAIVIACSKNWMVEDLTRNIQLISDNFEDPENLENRKFIKKALQYEIFNGRRSIYYKLPWKSFQEDMQAIYSGEDVLKISYRELKRQRGMLHGDTIRSVKNVEKGRTYRKIELAKLSSSTIKLLREGKFEKVLVNAEKDKDMCIILQERILKFDEKAKVSEIFSEPLKRGHRSRSAIIKSIKILDDGNGIPMRGGVVTMTANGKTLTWKLEVYSMINKKGEKIYGGIPVYKISSQYLNNNEVLFGKTNKVNKEDCKYELTLYPNTPVQVTDSKGNIYEGRYINYDKTTNRVILRNFDSNKDAGRITLTSCKSIKILSREIC